VLTKASSDHDRNDKDYLNNEELAAQCARALRNLSLNRTYTYVRPCLTIFLKGILSFNLYLSCLDISQQRSIDLCCLWNKHYLIDL
jgi:hypothetical protein